MTTIFQYDVVPSLIPLTLKYNKLAVLNVCDLLELRQQNELVKAFEMLLLQKWVKTYLKEGVRAPKPRTFHSEENIKMSTKLFDRPAFYLQDLSSSSPAFPKVSSIVFWQKLFTNGRSAHALLHICCCTMKKTQECLIAETCKNRLECTWNLHHPS